MMDYPKAGMHAPILGQRYSLGTKVHEDRSENVGLQWKEILSGFLDYDDTEYNGILDALGAGIYICATVHSFAMIVVEVQVAELSWVLFIVPLWILILILR